MHTQTPQASTRRNLPIRRRWCLGIALATALAGTAAPALAQANQPVSLIVPLAPGGIADVTARPLAIPLAKELGQAVVVENRVGAGGSVGTGYAARQKPDGNTLLMALSSILIAPEADKVVGRTPAYAFNQFTPIALVSADPTVLVVRANSPWKTIDDVIKAARAKPLTLTYSSSGVYGTTHVALEMLWQAAGVKLLHVPYNGGGPSLAAILGGQVDINAQAPGLVTPHVKAGTLRMLGTWGAERLPAWPDVPTFKEQGYNVEFYIWSGLFAPAGLPEPKLAQLRAAARKATTDQGFVNAMTTMNTPIRHMEGAELDRFLQEEQGRLSGVIKAMGKLE